MALHERLKLAVLRSGLPAYHVAAKAGLSETQLSRIMQGRREPNWQEKSALNKALGRKWGEVFDPIKGPTTCNGKTEERVMSSALQASLKRLLVYSFVDADFKYDGITPIEKSLISKEEFEELLVWMKSDEGETHER